MEYKYFRIDIDGIEEGAIRKGELWSINNYLDLYSVNVLKYKKPVTASLVQDQITSTGQTKTKIQIDTPEGVDKETMRKMSRYVVGYVCVWIFVGPLLTFTIEAEPDTP